MRTSYNNLRKVLAKLNIINLQEIYPIDKNRIKKLVKGILKAEKKEAELNIVFTDNKRIREINKTFLGHNYATDVLSFDYGEHPLRDGILNGEVVVSAEMAVKQAQKRGHAVEGEIALYVTHGLLHMLKYNDRQKREAEKMHKREEELLLNLGYTINTISKRANK